MRQGVVLLCAALMVFLVGTAGFAGARNPHGTIAITNDYEFTPANGVCSGSGTADDPYIIEDWIIDAGGQDHGIMIRGTTRSFVIRNVEISGAAKSAIYFSYVRNGTVTGSVLTGNWAGITLSFSSLNRLSANRLASNGDGLRLVFSSRNQILDNDLHRHDTAIWLDASDHNVILRNLVADGYTGAYLNLGSKENLFAGNAFYQNVRHAYADAFNRWDQDRSGNYWHGFSAIDADGDGIWDAPYRVPGQGNHDQYPLTSHPLVPAAPPATCSGG